MHTPTGERPEHAGAGWLRALHHKLRESADNGAEPSECQLILAIMRREAHCLPELSKTESLKVFLYTRLKLVHSGTIRLGKTKIFWRLRK